MLVNGNLCFLRSYRDKKYKKFGDKYFLRILNRMKSSLVK